MGRENLAPNLYFLRIVNNGLSKEKEREWKKEAFVFIRYNTFNVRDESMIRDMSCSGLGKLAMDKALKDMEKYQLRHPNVSKKRLSRRIVRVSKRRNVTLNSLRSRMG